MTIASIIEYFQTLSTQHKEIRHTEAEPHFFRFPEEAEEALRSNLNTKCVILSPPEFNLYEKTKDNNQKQPTISFLVLDKVGQNDFTAELQAYNNCEQIAIDFITKMRYDSINCPADSITDYIDINDVLYEPIGPVMDNFYGVVIDFTISQQVDMEYNPDKWLP